nr:ATP-binding cassette domain-containing protein [Hymenobacter qilianensis]
MPILEIENLSKNYGSTQALKGLNLTVEAGSVYGLLGPNGSGKTTTLGIALGVLQPSGAPYAGLGGKFQVPASVGWGLCWKLPTFSLTSPPAKTSRLPPR